MFTPEQGREMQARTEAARRGKKWPGETFETAAGMVEKLAPKDERELHNQIIAYCKSRGWIYLHGSMAKETARTVGEPDFVIMTDRGRTLFIECKTAKGKLSPAQLALHKWAEKLGHTIFICRSMDEFMMSIVDNVCRSHP